MSGDPKEIGAEQGTGFNINLAWNSGKGVKEVANITDKDYQYAFNEVVLPILS